MRARLALDKPLLKKRKKREQTLNMAENPSNLALNNSPIRNILFKIHNQGNMM